MKTALVTGANGYIGAWIVHDLLEKGYTVRGTVRDISNPAKTEHLKSVASKMPGKLELWQADLLNEGAFDKAAEGVDVLFHVASPFKINVDNAQSELLGPALQGTRNVLEAANRSTTVKRVVLTSSVAAVYGDAIDMKEQNLDRFSEAQFNTSSSDKHQPYPYSKTIAEREAWKIHDEQSQWTMVTINPSFVIGPPMMKTSSQSITFMTEMLDGTYKTGLPELWFGMVSVRDVAQAHIRAAENEEAEGRFIVSNDSWRMMDIAAALKDKYNGEYKIPTSTTPKLFAFLIGRFFGLSPKFVSRNVGYPVRFDNSKSQEVLNIEYADTRETIYEMAEALIDLGLVK